MPKPVGVVPKVSRVVVGGKGARRACEHPDSFLAGGVVKIPAPRPGPIRGTQEKLQR